MRIDRDGLTTNAAVQQEADAQAADAPGTAENGAPGKVKLVTVHGTGAGDTTTSGERWWQLGSPFLVALAERLDLDPARVEVVPFQWQLGPNSEQGRREGGKALCERLHGYDRAGEDYYLIGHSHGGSVIYNALLHSVARRRPFERLKCWCTVGTPFLDYSPNRHLFQRLGSAGLTLYVTAIGALIFSAMMIFLPMLFGNQVVGMDSIGGAIFLLAALPYGIFALLFLYIGERFRGGWRSKKQKMRVAELYAGRWFGLWHREDEAISALSNVKHVSGPIIPSTFLMPFFGMAPLLLTILGAIYLGYDLLAANGGMATALLGPIVDISGFLDDSYKQITGTNTLPVWLSIIMGGIGAMGAYVALTFIATLALKQVAGWLGIPLAKLINGLVWSSVRQRAWGDDMIKEGVSQIGSHPAEFASAFVPIPAAIADPLSRHSEKHAILTLQKVREVLGMTEKPPSSPDLRSQLSEKLNWRELIHTSYFDIAEFIDLTALGLHHAGLAELREEFSGRDAGRAQAEDWYSAIRQVKTLTQVG